MWWQGNDPSQRVIPYRFRGVGTPADGLVAARRAREAALASREAGEQVGKTRRDRIKALPSIPRRTESPQGGDTSA